VWTNEIISISHNPVGGLREIFVYSPANYPHLRDSPNGYYDYSLLSTLNWDSQLYPEYVYSTKIVINSQGYPEIWVYTGSNSTTTPYLDNIASGKWKKLNSEIGFFEHGAIHPLEINSFKNRQFYYDTRRKELSYNTTQNTKNWNPVFNYDLTLTYNGEILIDEASGNILTS
jgi:hypothetical protein